MKTRTWPYGTKYPVRVVSRDTSDNHVIVAVVFENPASGEKEGFICVLNKTHEAAFNAKPGDFGTITFREGGPYGGFWDYEKRQQMDSLENWAKRQGMDWSKVGDGQGIRFIWLHKANAAVLEANNAGFDCRVYPETIAGFWWIFEE